MHKFNNTASSKFISLLCFLILINISQVFSQTLDVTFGNTGKVVSHIRNKDAYINDVAIQSDGKIIVAGILYEPMGKYLLVRYDTDGSIDSSFGLEGAATRSIGVNSNDIRSIAIQADGKIVAGGTIQEPYSSDTHFALVRFNSNGSIDSTFGANGLVATIFQSGPDIHEELQKVIIKPDGKILAGGYSYNSFLANSPNKVILAQYNERGTYDSSFGTNGTVISSTSTGNSKGFTMVLRSDKKIVAGGPHGNSSFGAMCFNSNGRIDSAFGINGFGDTAISFSVSDALLPTDGKIIFVGSMIASNQEMIALLKYNNDGTFDTTFGNNGKVTTSFSNSWNNATSVQLDPNGKLLVSGYVYQTASAMSADFALIRYNSDGTLDSKFGKDGLTITDFSGKEDRSHASAIQSDGKIVLAGISRYGTESQVALARYGLGVLPLKLLSFFAKKDGKNNHLQWQAAQEINVDRFEIQRSFDGREYGVIGKLNAGLSKYNFTDNKPFMDIILCKG